MKNLSLSIKTQLILILVSISTSIILAIAYFTLNSNIQQEKNRFLQNSIIQANLLADFTVSALIFNDEDGTIENLNKLRNDKNILRAIIFDKKGDVFAQYNPFNFNTPKKIEKKIFFDTNNEDLLNFGVLKIPLVLKHQSNIYGTLYIEKSTKIITELLNKIIKDVIIFIIILIILTYFISLTLSNYLLKPIVDLAKISKDIASTQNYSTRVSYDSKNEIGSLYNSFNILLKDTQNLTNNLEKQVGIRTKELEKSLNDLRQTQQQLVESEKMSALGNLVSGIAHEVNTPLGNAITSSSIISKETKLLIEEFEKGTLTRSQMEKKLDILNKSSELLSKTLNYASGLIKSFKQISIDQVTNDSRIFDINTYIEEIFLTNHNKLKLVPVEVNLSTKETIKINTSPGVIAQIFNNLIQNSIIHGFEDSKKSAKIDVSLKTKDNLLIIEYRDNGKGINEDIKEKIFEPFITTKRNAGGTGLGLNIVYNLVYQKLKGSIKVESKKNIETKFIIQIPLNHSKRREI